MRDAELAKGTNFAGHVLVSVSVASLWQEPPVSYVQKKKKKKKNISPGFLYFEIQSHDHLRRRDVLVPFDFYSSVL